MAAASPKDLLYEKWNVEELMTELLGPGKRTVRHCWNRQAHRSDDRTPSLSFSPQHGGWRCHACGEKGDVFTLFMKVKEWDFQTTLTFLLKKYGLVLPLARRTVPSKTEQYSAPGKARVLKQSPSLAAEAARLYDSWQINRLRFRQDASKLDFLLRRYGISSETAEKYQLCHDYRPGSSRLLIPIWAEGVGGPIVNIRQHDYMRSNCAWLNPGLDQVSTSRPPFVTQEKIRDQDTAPWEAIWRRAGKVTSVAGYGSCYLYPLSTVVEKAAFYLVGGELKALLLLGQGLPAVSWTGGEGSFNLELLPLFLGKRVRVLFDPDEAGEQGAERVAQELANWGAYVEKGSWPEAALLALPPKGDVTDYARAVGLENLQEGLNLLTWTSQEAKIVTEQEDVVGLPVGRLPVAQDIVWEEMKNVPFGELVNPDHVGSWVKWPGVVAGRSEAPFVIPREATFSCPFGEREEILACRKCRLPKSSFRLKVVVSLDQQLQWVGRPPDQVKKELLMEAGIPKCPHPKIETFNSAIDRVFLAPAVDYEGDEASFKYELRAAYVIQPSLIQMRDNTIYEFGGQVVPDPVTGRFTSAITQYHGTKSDIFHFQPDLEKEKALSRYFGGGTVGERLHLLVNDLRDHLFHIIDSDGMLLSILLSYFLPFRFRIAGVRNERICPTVLVLGDTIVGKSTVSKAIVRHFGAGRFKSMDQSPTFAGLVGGNLPVGDRMAFHWGIIPTTNLGHVTFDEFAKLPVEEVGRLTSLTSSGIAERTTVNGDRSTQCWVRLLYMSNPRGQRPLRSCEPMDAAQAVMGTTQDLGRLEFVHIQPEATNKTRILNYLPSFEPPALSPSLARYLLSWAWHLNEERIVFESDEHLISSSVLLAQKWGHSTLMISTIARWKLARLAIGLASLSFSCVDHDRVLVTKEHVEYARLFYDARYSPWLKSAEDFSLLPTAVVQVLNRMTPYLGLRTLARVPKFTRDDVYDHLPRMEGGELLSQMTREGLLTKNGLYYSFLEPQTQEKLLQYVAARGAQEELHE